VGQNKLPNWASPAYRNQVSIIFFTQALLDNIATWISDAFPLPVKGGERNFRSSHFRRELKKRANSAVDVVSSHEPFVDEVNRYRQVWIHTLAGGSIPIADDNPFTNPEMATKVLGVPIDPAIQFGQEDYVKRVEECAIKNGGRYYYELGEFTGRIFAGASRFYLDWLRFALDSIKKP